MLLSLRSLWERITETCRGAGLLLGLSSLVNECASASTDVSFTVTGVAANPQVGDIANVSGTQETSSGGALHAFRLALQREARRQEKARSHISFEVLGGVAANPRIGRISEVAVSVSVSSPARARARARFLTSVHTDFPIHAGPFANADIGYLEKAATTFQVIDGAAATPFIPADIVAETTFDLLEEEWIALLLAA